MQQLGQIMTHLRLVLRMGRATGADIVDAHRSGQLSQEEWAEMIQYCRGCEWASSCPDWLDENDVAEAAPKLCCNRARFAKLKTKRTKVN